MKEEKYSIKTGDNDPGVLYLELSDLSEASIQIWEEEGEKKAFVRIKLSKEELEKIVNEYKHIQTL
jgi:peptidyl-tRNA hydrolase